MSGILIQGFRRIISFLTAAVNIADRFNFSLFVEAPDRPRFSVTSSNTLSIFKPSAVAAYRYDEEVLFTINYRAGLTTAYYVEYNGVKYSVTRIDTFEGYKQDITLYCKRQ